MISANFYIIYFRTRFLIFVLICFEYVIEPKIIKSNAVVLYAVDANTLNKIKWSTAYTGINVM